MGQCKLGAACRHAHDPSELVDLPQKAITDDVEAQLSAPLDLKDFEGISTLK